MLEAQIAQEVSSSFKCPSRLPSELESNPCDHCNCVTFKEAVEDPSNPADIQFEKGSKIIMVESKETNDGGKPMTFLENESLEIPTIFQPKLPDPGSFSITFVKGTVEIKRALCDLGASISLMSDSLCHKLHLGSLQPRLFSLQLADGSEMQSLGKLEGVLVKI